MQVTTFEGVIENGKIKLKTNVNLPENMKVYVIIPGLETKKIAHVYSPRLVHPEQAAHFKKEIVEESQLGETAQERMERVKGFSLRRPARTVVL